MKFVWLLLLAAGVCTGCTKVSEGPAQAPPAHAAGAAASASARHAATVPHTLRIGDILDVTSLNPHLDTPLSLGYMSTLTMAYLVRYGRDNHPIPELATVVPTKRNHLISPDGLTITWHLRRGVKWSDGAPFDADDVVFSTDVVNNPRNNEVGRDGWDLITKIDEPDKFTVVYHLKKPYSGFLPSFFGTAGANPCILPKHLLGKLPNINTAEYNSKPVGIGPFRYLKWVRGDRVEMEANPYYWRGVPKLHKIIYKFIPDRNTLLTQIQTGEIDLWPQVGLGYFGRVSGLPNVRTIHAPGYSYLHIDFNMTRPVFAERAVREALRYAVDRATIQLKTQHGLGILQEGPITPSSPLYTALPRIPFDLARANRLLDAAGWQRGPDGIRIKNGRRLAFDLAVTTGQPDIDSAIELIRATWQQIGAQLNLEHYASATMFAPYQQGGILFGSKFDTILFSWQVTPDGDLSPIFGCHEMPPNGENTMRYCNPKAEADLNAAKGVYDEDERKPIIAAEQREMIADVPTIVMWVRDNIFSYNSDLTGWHPNAVTPFDDMLDVDI